MANVKNGKLVSLNFKGSQFGEGVIFEPTRTANEQGSGGSGTAVNCLACCCILNCSSGCGSSNKIQVYR